MLSRDRRRQIAKDFIVAVSDRRLELNGSRWQQAIGEFKLNGDGPTANLASRHRDFQALELESRCSASTLDKAKWSEVQNWTNLFRLSQMLRYSVLPLRWEPHNYIAEHRGVATAGGLFGTDVYLTGNYCGSVQNFYLSPSHQKLLHLGPSDRHTANSDIHLTVAAAMDRITPTYADFGLCLAGLEGGMIIAQFFLTAKRLGLKLSFSPVAPQDQYASQGYSNKVELFTLSISFDNISPFDQMRQKAISAVIPSEPPEVPQKMPMLEQLFQIGVEPAHASVDKRQTRRISDHESNLFDVTLKRSSGRPYAIGRPKIGPELLEVQTIIRLALNYYRELPRLMPGEKLITTLAICNFEQPGIALYNLSIHDGCLVENTFQQYAEDAIRDVCSGEFNIVVTIGASTSEMVEMIADGRIVQLYASAGLLGQCLSLASAKIGAVARPYRAMPDNFMNLLLPGNTRGLLQLLIGARQEPHLAFPL